MVQDAQQHADEDKRRREEVEIRNRADTTAYQVERQLKELGDRAPMHVKARAEQLVSDIRKALEENADIDRLRTLTGDLQQVSQSLTEAESQSTQSDGHESRTGGHESRTGREDTQEANRDDVVDAEFTPR
jgi:molecular chaperone DnaK